MSSPVSDLKKAGTGALVALALYPTFAPLAHAPTITIPTDALGYLAQMNGTVTSSGNQVIYSSLIGRDVPLAGPAAGQQPTDRPSFIGAPTPKGVTSPSSG
jgi:hypothetical protein